MHYYIDGYNLLFRVLQAGDEVRKQREQITYDLEKKIRLLQLDATLVFDSHYQEDENVRSHYKSLEIVFTAKNETADEYILHELKESKTPSNHTVVTSDKKLARLCQIRLAKILSIDEFLGWLNKRYKNKLRQIRTPPIPSPTLPKLTPPLKKPEVISPKAQDTAESCFNFYLEAFEKEFQQLEPPKPLEKKKTKEIKQTKVKKRSLTQEEQSLSDIERWQKAFENPLNNDSDLL